MNHHGIGSGPGGTGNGDHRAASAASLRRQWRQAALLLIFPWLTTLVYCGPEFGRQPVRGLALLPGLALAAYLLAHLRRHLQANHPPGEAERRFSTLGAANWITLFRGAAVVALAGFFPLIPREDGSLSGAMAWMPGLIYLGLSLADALDGLVARKQGRESELGRQLDTTIDAAGLLVASLLAVSLGKLPALYLLAGAAYYLFRWGIRRRQRRDQPLAVLRPRPYARIIAGFQMGLVGVALLPPFSAAFTIPAGYIFMLPLLAGFLRDWLVVSCRLKTDEQQLTVWDRRAAMVWTGMVPVPSRVLLLSAGIALLADNALWRANPLWSLALAGCCLGAGSGFTGRTAALALMLLLGLRHSPFGADAHSLLVFSASSLLLLTGTGAFSLWAPEEALLYRRPRKGPAMKYLTGRGRSAKMERKGDHHG
jgi:CDP-diacylglycerol---glycerol-3-phosphate 3-phosphatidyltransferase